jgi:glycosyltransferase involved in cell wall biosynthesis
MHIGFLSPEYPYAKKPEGGLGNYIRKVAMELVRRGHRVTVFVSGVHRGDQNDKGIELRFIPKVRVYWRLMQNPKVVPWLELYEWWLNARRMQQAVLKYHRHFPLDIVQTTNYKMPGFALCHNRLFPLVCRCSSYEPLRRAAYGHRSLLTDTIYDWLEVKQSMEADAVFAPSQLIAQIYERLEVINLQVIRTPLELPPVVEDDSVYRALVDGKKFLLFFGALNGIKGADVLIQAAPEILEQNHNLTLLFIGKNDILPNGDGAFETIEQKLSSCIQERRVIYSPSLPREQLYPIIQHAFGVVLPSRVDNYPNTCLEALALGVPVIGTRQSSIDEMISDGVTGFLAENGSPSSLKVAISHLLLQTPRQRAAMLKAIKQEVKKIDDEDRVSILLQFYQDIISEYLKCK